MPDKHASILIVEDDDLIGESLLHYFSDTYVVDWETSIAGARTALMGVAWDLVILDMHLPDGDATEILRLLPDTPGNTQAIVVTAFPKVQMAVRTLQMGALDYIDKPFELEDLEMVIEKALRSKLNQQNLDALQLESQPRVGTHLDQIIGNSEPMRELKQKLGIVAGSQDTTVLITGETGTGKELVAEAIHKLSPRNARPFVRVNCSSIPESLIESELFGHEKGAFTDAKHSRKGFIEMASGGTLFLDEVGEFSMNTQSKLLRFLESKSFMKVGAERETRVDVRVIAATNRDLEDMIANKEFRPDLFFRLNVFNLHLPPLRERSGDIRAIAEHYLDYYARKLGRAALPMSDTFAQDLLMYDWPGNIREVRNIIERSTILGEFPRLSPGNNNHGAAPSDDEFRVEPLDQVEKRHIIRVYRALDNNKTRAAQALGINRLTLRKKLEEYGVQD